MLLYGLQLAQRRMTARIEQRLRRTESVVHADLLRAMAEEIVSLANSLAIEVACGQTSSTDARATMHYYLDRALGAR